MTAGIARAHNILSLAGCISRSCALYGVTFLSTVHSKTDISVCS